MALTTPPEKSDNSIKIVFFLLFTISMGLMLALASSLASAENQNKNHSNERHHEKRRGPNFEAISTELLLSSEEIDQLKLILKSHHQNHRSSHRALREQHKESLDNDLATLLSKDQIIQLHTILKKNRPRPPCRQPCNQFSKSSNPS